eukprot:TRINITY_DN126_c0_g2_i1.p1 TRINITY_DN126_c0_g2~~TRINITY_DN126_c0_g2_i1.p1  ORF type:complete len:819 (+),score=375.82 TRINITY_DN126_c0_g2_i1:60-2516(+)
MAEIPEATLDVVRAGMKTVKAPTSFDMVYKDECMLSFETPFSAGGLYVSLTTWQGYGEGEVAAYAQRTGETLFLHEKWVKVDKPKEEQPEVTKLAIGMEGGFAGTAQFDIVKDDALAVVRPGAETLRLPLSKDLPTLVLNACEGVVKSDGASFKEEVTAWEDTDAVTESKYAANLEQLPDAPKISPDSSTWVCPVSGAKENLWLNLSTGYIGGGRKFWDGTGGSGSALDHFNDTGKKYPLAVKLGTITPHGADVYSYADDEDRSCSDPKLAEHLAHFGIDIMKQEKTTKTTAELSVELNKFHDYSKILEDTKELQRMYGAGFQGLHNLGNSCYISSVLQVLADTPELKARYVTHGDSIRSSVKGNPAEDLLAQLSKALTVLNTGAHSKEGEDENPAYQARSRMFKSLVGRGHSEFSTSHQQDAYEYLDHVLSLLTKAERQGRARLSDGSEADTVDGFTYSLVERLECGASHKVRYTTATGNILKLGVPVSQEVKERQAKRPRLDPSAEEPVPVVTFEQLMGRFEEQGTVLDWWSPATKAKTHAYTSQRFKTFPKTLCMMLGRYYVSETWEPKKLEVEVKMPEEIDLSAYRTTAELKHGEEALPEAEQPKEAAPKEAAVEPNEEILAQLVSMGFDLNGCMRACIATKNAGADAAMEWVLAHMEDPDFTLPPEASAPADTAAAAPAQSFDPEAIATLCSFGFGDKVVKKALKATGGNTERAADWLFSHPDDNGEEDEPAAAAAGAAPAAASGAALDDGPGAYSLVAMISHIGKNTGSGHYVAHVKKGGAWYLFNDDKVARSEEPPFSHAYMYFYRRTDSL